MDGLAEELVTFVVLVFFLGAEADDILYLLDAEGELLFGELDDEAFEVGGAFDLGEVVGGTFGEEVHTLDNGEQDLNRALLIQTHQLRIHQVDQKSSESHRQYYFSHGLFGWEMFAGPALRVIRVYLTLAFAEVVG